MRNILKKYGFTVSAVGMTVSALTRDLTSVAKGVGNGFKTLGSKIVGIYPGLIVSIVNFIFKTAGSVISFLGKNAWLLIKGVIIFMV